MPPRKLTAIDPERARYKIVRRDNFVDVPGLIMAANVDTGLCLLRDANGVSQEHKFEPDGFAIVAARR
ncbi:MAG TPA: hypothetical protein VMS01_04130 [Stellaceae bacterium]|nr:hypothetical protein [Stellaceae bacterium]